MIVSIIPSNLLGPVGHCQYCLGNIVPSTTEYPGLSSLHNSGPSIAKKECCPWCVGERACVREQNVSCYSRAAIQGLLLVATFRPTSWPQCLILMWNTNHVLLDCVWAYRLCCFCKNYSMKYLESYSWAFLLISCSDSGWYCNYCYCRA